jgi:hypothetical protein
MDIILILLGVLFLLGVGISITGRRPLVGTFSFVFGFWLCVAICIAYGWLGFIVGWGIYIVVLLLFARRFMDDGKLD